MTGGEEGLQPGGGNGGVAPRDGAREGPECVGLGDDLDDGEPHLCERLCDGGGLGVRGAEGSDDHRWNASSYTSSVSDMGDVERVPQRRRGDWTFLSNHAHVLVCIDRDPTIRTRDIAAGVGITERATQAIVSDLVDAGYLTRRRDGRRNVYTVIVDVPFRHPIESNHAVGDLLAMLDEPSRVLGTEKK